MNESRIPTSVTRYEVGEDGEIDEDTATVVEVHPGTTLRSVFKQLGARRFRTGNLVFVR